MKIQFTNVFGEIVNKADLRVGKHSYFGESVLFGQSDLDQDDPYDDSPMYYLSGVAVVEFDGEKVTSAVAITEDGNQDIMDLIEGEVISL